MKGNCKILVLGIVANRRRLAGAGVDDGASGCCGREGGTPAIRGGGGPPHDAAGPAEAAGCCPDRPDGGDDARCPASGHPSA
jgi:hypothetical protein